MADLCLYAEYGCVCLSDDTAQPAVPSGNFVYYVVSYAINRNIRQFSNPFNSNSAVTGCQDYISKLTARADAASPTPAQTLGSNAAGTQSMADTTSAYKFVLTWSTI